MSLERCRLMKKIFLVVCLVIIAVSVSGCGDRGEEKPAINSPYNSADTNSSSSGSEGNDEYVDSDPEMDQIEKVCPHCGGDPNHICQQCVDGCYLCGGSGYVYGQ